MNDIVKNKDVLVSSIFDSAKYYIEKNYQNVLDNGRLSINKRPTPPVRKDQDYILSEAEEQVRQQEGFFESLYYSFIDNKKRTAAITACFHEKVRDSDAAHISLYENYLSRLGEFNKERNDLTDRFNEHIEESFQDWLEEVVVDKNPYPTPIDLTQIDMKLIRAAYYGLIDKNGLTFDRLPDDERSKINMLVLQRDDYLCVICGANAKKRKFQVHHIIPLKYKETNNKANLASLCINCHDKQHPGGVTNPNSKSPRPRTGGSFVAVDIETTGFSSQDEIIEVAAIKFIDGEPERKFRTLIFSDVIIPERISIMTGITNEMLINKPTIDIVLPRLVVFIGDMKVVMHNKSFDMRFLNKAAEQIGLELNHEVHDTLTLARTKLPDLSSHKLQDVAAYFNIYSGQAHHALDDALTTGKIYIACLNHRKQRATKKRG